MSKVEQVSTGYEPREHQAELHRKLKRFNVLVCHRRFGKTVFSINEMIDQGLRCKNKNPRYAYVAPLYAQAKRIAWDYLKDYTKDIPGAASNEADLRVDIPHNGCRFSLFGADNPDSLRGVYLDGVILDEYSEMMPRVWTEVIRPALSDRGGWVIFIGTPKGRNHFYELFQYAKNDDEWFTALYKGEETGIIPQIELDRMKSTMDDAEYAQEIQCSFDSALVGAYYLKEMQAAEAEKRITDLPHDPALPVHTAWDLGVGDTTAIWFWQEFGPRLQFIDYLEDDGIGLSEYARRLNEKPYNYGTHYLPHDAKARDITRGETREGTLRRHLRGSIITLPRESVEDGIHAARITLKKSWFDKTKCDRGIESLKSYRRKWDQKKGMFENRPVHNWASHASDAFRYAAKGARGDYDKKDSLPPKAITEYDVFGEEPDQWASW